MVLRGKYEATGPEAEFEPGSRGRVLRNLLGITRVRDMNEAESQALELAQEAALDRYGADHRFTADDICALHRLWLGPVYPWGGRVPQRQHRQGWLPVRACTVDRGFDGGTRSGRVATAYGLSRGERRRRGPSLGRGTRGADPGAPVSGRQRSSCPLAGP